MKDPPLNLSTPPLETFPQLSHSRQKKVPPAMQVIFPESIE
jgi:hypothetical protein